MNIIYIHHHLYYKLHIYIIILIIISRGRTIPQGRVSRGFNINEYRIVFKNN